MNIAAKFLFAVLCCASAAAHAETAVEMETDYGTVRLLLDEQKAPKTVANFVRYARKGFYDQTVFHRVIDGFMIQGGGYTADLQEKQTEKAVNSEADNGLSNRIGTIAMARSSNPNSATSQFFINVADNHALNFRNKSIQGYGYTVFGKVTEGMDVVRRIAKVPTGNRGYLQNVPKQTVLIKKVRILD